MPIKFISQLSKFKSSSCFCLRPVSEADAEGLGTTISPLFRAYLTAVRVQAPPQPSNPQAVK
jgi:hypothetical protein